MSDELNFNTETREVSVPSGEVIGKVVASRLVAGCDPSVSFVPASRERRANPLQRRTRTASEISAIVAFCQYALLEEKSALAEERNP